MADNKQKQAHNFQQQASSNQPVLPDDSVNTAVPQPPAESGVPLFIPQMTVVTPGNAQPAGHTLPVQSFLGQSDPLDQLALMCAFVAKGNSTERLRVLARQLCPKTVDEAKRFQEILDRFRLAANALYNYGNEEYVGLIR